MTYTMPALYVPKSVTMSKEGDGVAIKIRGVNWLILPAIAFAAFLILIVLPIQFVQFARYGHAAGMLLTVIVAIGIVIGSFFVNVLSPALKISPAGIELRDCLYRAEDASHFTEGADDSWLSLYMSKVLKLNYLGLSYGIYNLRMPYILSAVEVSKVAPFLTGLLKAQSEQLSAERARKVQQAQEF